MAEGGGSGIDREGVPRRPAAGRDRGPVEFVPDKDPGESLVEALTEAARRADLEVPGLRAGPVTVTVDGAAFDLGRPDGAGPPDRWLAGLARELAARGLAGRLRPTPLAELPRWYDRPGEPRLVAYLLFDGPARELPAAVEWVAGLGGEPAIVVETAGLRQRCPDGGLPAHLARVLAAGQSPAVIAVDDPGRRSAHLAVEPDGGLVLQLHDPDADPAVLVARMTEALLLDPPRTRLAFVAPATENVRSWGTRSAAAPPLPTVSQRVLLDQPGLWRRFVPDAHGLQLVTARHLAKAFDLTGWQVRGVAPDRFLVTAPHPADWLWPGGPDPVTLSRSRAAFGSMIVVPDGLR